MSQADPPLSSKPDAPKRPASRIGRLIALGLYAAFFGYCGFVVLSGIVRDLYGRPPPDREASLDPAERAWCVRRLTGLRSEIEGRVRQAGRAPPEVAARHFHKWNDAWTEKFEAARERCSGFQEELTRVFDTLAVLHTDYAEAIERIIQTRANTGAELDKALKDLLPKR